MHQHEDDSGLSIVEKLPASISMSKLIDLIPRLSLNSSQLNCSLKNEGHVFLGLLDYTISTSRRHDWESA